MTPMEEKRVEITDNYIIKDLNRCANTDASFCKECTHRNFIYSDESSCCIRLMKSAIDLINRQKAEIERLEKENIQFADIGKIKTEAVKKFLEGKKEVMLSTGMGKYSVSINEVIDSLLEGVEEAVGEGK